MSRALPPRPSLDRLRREARALQRACLAGDGQAARRLGAIGGELSPRQLALTKAQTVIAREYGFASWPRLKAHVETAAVRVVKAPAADPDAEALAERWFSLAEAGDAAALGRSFVIGKARTQAARAVMRLDPVRYQAFVQVLIDGLVSRRARVRFELAHALDTFGGADCRPHLIALMEDPVPRVRWVAMHALSCHACGDAPAALEAAVAARIGDAALGDPSIKVRRNAVIALGLAGARTELLRALAATDADFKVRRNAEWALSRMPA